MIASWTEGVRRRWPVLGSVWFLGAVAVLLVNDHLLKSAVGGWWTGKLSDVAGVVVVAVVASVVVGRSPAVGLTALGFTALKLVPGVAEAAVPLLGGWTRRDVTDLLALPALAPAWWALGLPAPPIPEGPVPCDARPRSSSGRPRRIAALVLPLLGAGTALVATTASSCVPDSAVTQVVADGPVLYARLSAVRDVWRRSDDAGRTWHAAAAPAGVVAPRGVRTGPDRGEPWGPAEACGRDACYRGRGDVVERRPDGASAWRPVHRLTERQRTRPPDGCSYERIAPLTSVAVLRIDGADVGVANLGTSGVLVEDGPDGWADRHGRRVRTGLFLDEREILHPPVPSSVPFALALGLFLPSAAVAALWRSHRRLLASVVAVVGGLVGAFASLLSWIGPGGRPLPVVVVAAVLAATVVLTRRVARSRPRARPQPAGPWGDGGWSGGPPGWLPPPPTPLPPPPDRS